MTMFNPIYSKVQTLRKIIVHNARSFQYSTAF